MFALSTDAPEWPAGLVLEPDGVIDPALASRLLPYAMHGELHLESWWRRRIWIPAATQLLEPFDQFRGASVLEIGFGNGRMSCFFAALGARVTGYDIIPAGPAIAEAGQWGCGNRVDFRRYDGDARELPDERYDVIFTKSVLGFSDRTTYRGLLEALASRLAPDGTALFLENVDHPVLKLYRRHVRYRRSRWDLHDFGLSRARVRIVEEYFPKVEIASHAGLVWTVRARGHR